VNFGFEVMNLDVISQILCCLTLAGREYKQYQMKEGATSSQAAMISFAIQGFISSTTFNDAE